MFADGKGYWGVRRHWDGVTESYNLTVKDGTCHHCYTGQFIVPMGDSTPVGSSLSPIIRQG